MGRVVFRHVLLWETVKIFFEINDKIWNWPLMILDLNNTIITARTSRSLAGLPYMDNGYLFKKSSLLKLLSRCQNDLAEMIVQSFLP